MAIKIESKTVEQNLLSFRYPKDVSFGKEFVPGMIRCHFRDGKWGDLELIDYGSIPLNPAAKVLHYSQEIFEGLKAYKNEDDQAFLFRPKKNAARFNESAKLMGMPEFPEDLFIESLKELVKYCAHSFGTDLNSSFYLRPFMIGDEPLLGVKPSTTYQYYLIGCPAGNYFSKESIDVKIERNGHRAAPKGVGNAKTGGNYAASMASSLDTIAKGHDQTLWLDPVHNDFIEELSGMNFFCVIDGVLHTPPVGHTILNGITRDSLITLAKNLGYEVREERLSLKKIFEQIKENICTEAFACGTASVVVPIAKLHDGSDSAKLKNSQGKISLELKDHLLKIQTGRAADNFNWSTQVDWVKGRK